MKIRSLAPSFVFLPGIGPPYPSILDFLVQRFPKISRQEWESRIASNLVLDADQHPITLDTPFVPSAKLFYYRESDSEPSVPFTEEILYQDAHILVADKPHFLPVTPSGPFVNECLVNRLKRKTGIDELSPLHRIDKETAGIVLFSTNRETRGMYQRLFAQGKVTKVYHAIAEIPADISGPEWLVENRLAPGAPWFRMKVEPGKINARTKIRLVEKQGETGFFHLQPFTGKKHQLRIHLCTLGCKIFHDLFYPELAEKQETDYSKPLQLLAKTIGFVDPVTKKQMMFSSEKSLEW